MTIELQITYHRLDLQAGRRNTGLEIDYRLLDRTLQFDDIQCGGRLTRECRKSEINDGAPGKRKTGEIVTITQSRGIEQSCQIAQDGLTQSGFGHDALPARLQFFVRLVISEAIK